MTELVQRDLTWARKITERLRLQATNYDEARGKVLSTLTEARDGGAADLLGYASWTAYMADVFGDAPLRLERDARQELVAELSEAGMSTRAIAPIVGASKDTVQRDIAGVSRETPEPEVVIHVDGGTGQVIDEPEPEPAPEPNKITGMDGKQYTRPQSSKPKADAITSRFSAAVNDLNKLLDRFHRLADDKAFRTHSETINILHSADINRAISELQTLADSL